MIHPGPATTDLKSKLEEMRASVGGEGTRKGLPGLVQDAFLKILEVLIALVMDFLAGKLASVAEPSRNGVAASPSPRPSFTLREGDDARQESCARSLPSQAGIGAIRADRGEADRGGEDTPTPVLTEVGGSSGSYELRVSARPLRRGERKPTWWSGRDGGNARGIRRAVPLSSRNGERLREAIFKNRGWVQEDWRGAIVPA
jgi:hypothetical protein